MGSNYAWEVISGLIGFAFDAIVSLGKTLWNDFLLFEEKAEADLATAGAVSSSTLTILAHIFFGDLFLILSVAGIALEAGLLIIEGATLGVGFIVNAIMTVLASYIITEV